MNGEERSIPLERLRLGLALLLAELSDEEAAEVARIAERGRRVREAQAA